MPSRLRRWQQLNRTTHLTTHRDGAVLELHYHPAGAIRAELAALLAAEARDCPFLTWTLDGAGHSRDGGPLVVRIEASAQHPGDIDPIVLLIENLRHHHDHPAAALPADGETS